MATIGEGGVILATIGLVLCPRERESRNENDPERAPDFEVQSQGPAKPEESDAANHDFIGLLSGSSSFRPPFQRHDADKMKASLW